MIEISPSFTPLPHLSRVVDVIEVKDEKLWFRAGLQVSFTNLYTVNTRHWTHSSPFW